ncbi:MULTISPECIES: hypothetical protein [Priestia]|nr:MULTISPECIES: hypothetical protein [Priestia]MBK0006223.1 hypothetical protein [Bacillus sp. S35]MCM3254903.1 hypothetical protein [Priestia aryabhattai]MCM3639904.1 hypothetical protein [Priestia aryabhattai]
MPLINIEKLHPIRDVIIQRKEELTERKKLLNMALTPWSETNKKHL